MGRTEYCGKGLRRTTRMGVTADERARRRCNYRSDGGAHRRSSGDAFHKGRGASSDCGPIHRPRAIAGGSSVQCASGFEQEASRCAWLLGFRLLTFLPQRADHLRAGPVGALGKHEAQSLRSGEGERSARRCLVRTSVEGTNRTNAPQVRRMVNWQKISLVD